MCRAGFDCHDCGVRFFVTPGGRDHPPSPPPPPLPPYQAVNLYDRWIQYNEMLKFDTDYDINLEQAGPNTAIGGCAGICGNYGVDDLETSPTNGYLDSTYPTAMPNAFKVKPFWWHGTKCTRFSGLVYIPSNSASADGVAVHLEQPLGTRISPRVVLRTSGSQAKLQAPLDPAIDHFHIMVDMQADSVGDTVYWERTTTTIHCHAGGYNAPSEPSTPPAPPPSPSPPPPEEALNPLQHHLTALWQAGSFVWDVGRIPEMAPHVTADNTGSFRFESGFGVRIVHSDELDAPRFAYATLALPGNSGYYCYRMAGCALLSGADTLSGGGTPRAKDGVAFRWMQDGYVLRNWGNDQPFQLVVGPQQVAGQDINLCYDLRLRGGFTIDYYSDRNPSGSADPDYWDKNVLDHNVDIYCAPPPPPGAGLPPPPPPPPVGTLVNLTALFEGGHVRFEREYDGRALFTRFQRDGEGVTSAIHQKHQMQLYLRVDVPDYMGKHCYRFKGVVESVPLDLTSDGFTMAVRWGDHTATNNCPAYTDQGGFSDNYVVHVHPLPNAFTTGLPNPAPFDFRLPGNIEGQTADRGFAIFFDNDWGTSDSDRMTIRGTVECEAPGSAWKPAAPPAPSPNIPWTHGCCVFSPDGRPCAVKDFSGYEGVGGNPTEGCSGEHCCDINGVHTGHGLCQDCTWWSPPQG